MNPVLNTKPIVYTRLCVGTAGDTGGERRSEGYSARGTQVRHRPHHLRVEGARVRRRSPLQFLQRFTGQSNSPVLKISLHMNVNWPK